MTPDEFKKTLQGALSVTVEDDRTREDRLVDELCLVFAQHVAWIDREAWEDACVRVADAYLDPAGINR